jgi:hypothetical protein
MIKKEKNRKFNLKIKSKDIDLGALFITKRLYNYQSCPGGNFSSL